MRGTWQGSRPESGHSIRTRSRTTLYLALNDCLSWTRVWLLTRLLVLVCMVRTDDQVTMTMFIPDWRDCNKSSCRPRTASSVCWTPPPISWTSPPAELDCSTAVILCWVRFSWCLLSLHLHSIYSLHLVTWIIIIIIIIIIILFLLLLLLLLLWTSG